jgi:hypothetical protein
MLQLLLTVVLQWRRLLLLMLWREQGERRRWEEKG